VDGLNGQHRGQRTAHVRDIKVAWFHQPRHPTLDAGLGDSMQRIAEAEIEAFASGFWQSVPWYWVNHPATVAVASNKLYQLHVAQQLGFPIPLTLVTSDVQRALTFLDRCANQVIIKDIDTQGITIDGEQYMSYTKRIDREELLARGIPLGVPICLQEYVPKSVEIRATVVGDQVFSVAIDSQAEDLTQDDYRRGSFEIFEARNRCTPTELPEAVERQCVALAQELGLEYGALDLILTPDGSYVFLELNTTGSWIWAEKLTGLPISESIADLLIARLDIATNTTHPRASSRQWWSAP